MVVNPAVPVCFRIVSNVFSSSISDRNSEQSPVVPLRCGCSTRIRGPSSRRDTKGAMACAVSFLNVFHRSSRPKRSDCAGSPCEVCRRPGCALRSFTRARWVLHWRAWGVQRATIAAASPLPIRTRAGRGGRRSTDSHVCSARQPAIASRVAHQVRSDVRPCDGLQHHIAPRPALGGGFRS